MNAEPKVELEVMKFDDPTETLNLVNPTTEEVKEEEEFMAKQEPMPNYEDTMIDDIPSGDGDSEEDDS